MYYVLLSLTGPQITFTAIHYVQCNKIFIQGHVLFLGEDLFLQVPDTFLTIITSICGPEFLSQKMSPAGLDGIMTPCSVALVGQTQVSSCLKVADTTASFQKWKCSGAFLVFRVICLHVVVTGTLSARVKRAML